MATDPFQEPHSIAPPSQHGDPALVENRRPLVLVTEDSTLLRNVIAEVLKVLGYDSLLAADGLEAVRKAERHKVDLVTMDIDMPIMDGLEATRQIRALGDWQALVPIVGFSSRDAGEDRKAGRDAGITILVSKRDGLERLVKIIAQLVPSTSLEPN